MYGLIRSWARWMFWLVRDKPEKEGEENEDLVEGVDMMKRSSRLRLSGRDSAEMW